MPHEHYLTIRQALAREEIDATILSASEAVPVDRLLVPFYDGDGNEVTLEMLSLNALTDTLGLAAQPGEVHLTQFAANLPFPVEASALGDTAMLLVNLNALMQFGAFGLSEDQNTVSYRQSLMTPTSEIDPALAVESVKKAGMFCNYLSPCIKAVARGERTYQEALAQLGYAATEAGNDGAKPSPGEEG